MAEAAEAPGEHMPGLPEAGGRLNMGNSYQTGRTDCTVLAEVPVCLTACHGLFLTVLAPRGLCAPGSTSSFLPAHL